MIMIVSVLLVCGLFNNINCQNMSVLDIKLQRISAIAVNTAIGNLEALRADLNAGLDAGLTVNQIKEILVHLYAYCGFPRSLQGISTFMAVIEERKKGGVNDTLGPEASEIKDKQNKYNRGKDNLEKLTGVYEARPSGANAFSPAIDIFLKEHLFADIFDRDVLTYQQREIVTISALGAMTGVDPMLRAHISMGKNTGLTDNEINEALSIARKNSEHFVSIFPRGNSGPSEWFTGIVHVQSLVDPNQIEDLYSVGQVIFEPSARTYWHTHPAGQVLLVTEGKGFYQERGKPAQVLTKGSVVAIPKDVEHWHGASEDSRLIHIAISNVSEGSAVTWMTQVTDEEYRETSLGKLSN